MTDFVVCEWCGEWDPRWSASGYFLCTDNCFTSWLSEQMRQMDG